MVELNDIEGEHDDEFANTLEKVGEKEVEQEYTDETRTTVVFSYTVEEPDGGKSEYRGNALRIGCPDCKENTLAIIRPDLKYECKCGYTNDLKRSTFFYQNKYIDVW